MSSNTRELGEPFYNGFFRRMANLPRNLLSGFSRVIGRRNNFQNQPFNFIDPSLQYQHNPPNTGEEWMFLTSFEQQYGSAHPFFYACKLTDALKMAEDDNKFMFMYLHSPNHPFTPSFCRETLCSEVVIQFLDANFVSWGALADRGEGLQMATNLQPGTFPCCAVVALPGNGDMSIAVLQQMEGPITPAELVEILQRTMEEQGSAFQREKLAKEVRTRRSAKEEEKIREDQRLREEQDAAYLAALQIDKEKERLRDAAPEKVLKPKEASTSANHEKLRQNVAIQKQSPKAKPSSVTKETRKTEPPNGARNPPANTAQILIRFPNGERREKSFACADKIQSIYSYIDSLGIVGIGGNYRLVSSFPRRVYGFGEIGMTLREAGLYPRASLFLELV